MHIIYAYWANTREGGDESGVAISQIPDLLGLYSLIPDFLGLYSLIPDLWGLYSLIPDSRPLCPVPTFSRPIIVSPVRMYSGGGGGTMVQSSLRRHVRVRISSFTQ